MYSLDHIVHFVSKPEKLVEETKRVGLHTVQGGKHEMWGTYNSLCYFGLSYIEFIGVFDRGLLEKSAKVPFTLHASYKKQKYKNGFTRLALRTNTIAEDAKRLKDEGYLVYGPEDFSRVRPDGSVAKWKLLHFGKEEQKIDFPFLIQWEGTDQERYDELVGLGTISHHQLGELTIEEISYIVDDISIAEEWAKVFHFELEEENISIKLKGPNTTIGFYQIDQPNSLTQQNISQVVISGAKEEKDVKLEGGSYKFVF